jgi:uncharacterized RDD family membrane protein YckC
VDPHSSSEVVGRRIAGGFVDLLVIIVLMILVGIAFGQGHSSSHGAAVNLHGASVAVFLVVAFAYYAVQELLWGQTLGTRLLRIRVVSRQGERPSVIAIGTRTLFRAVDFLPFLYLLGSIAIGVVEQRNGHAGRSRFVGALAARATRAVGLYVASLLAVVAAGFLHQSVAISALWPSHPVPAHPLP